jgi:hypothetical protein
MREGERTFQPVRQHGSSGWAGSSDFQRTHPAQPLASTGWLTSSQFEFEFKNLMALQAFWRQSTIPPYICLHTSQVLYIPHQLNSHKIHNNLKHFNYIIWTANSTQLRYHCTTSSFHRSTVIVTDSHSTNWSLYNNNQGPCIQASSHTAQPTTTVLIMK